MLLAAVGSVGRQGPPLVAFFALMCYAALRPEEVASLKKQNLSLPEKDWGDLNLERRGRRSERSGRIPVRPTKKARSSIAHRIPGARCPVPN
jgi:hypothetical protein